MRRLIKLGTATYVAADTVVHINAVTPGSPEDIKVQGVKEHGSFKLYDCTGGKQVNSVVITESDRMYLTNHTIETIAERVFGRDKQNKKAKSEEKPEEE